MRILKLVLLIIFIFIVFFYFRITIAPFLDKKIYSIKNKSEKINTPKTKEECFKKSGEWRRPGPWPKETCMLKTKDAEKFCLSVFQCETGYCLHQADLRNESFFASGKCPSYQIFFGCFQEVHFGLTERAICLD